MSPSATKQRRIGFNKMAVFEPTLAAARQRLAAVHPDNYARTRNAVDGAVTRLSPYLTHGLLSLREVYTGVHARHPLDAKHKLVFELGWRAYWRHVWTHLGDEIHQSLHAGVLRDDAYHTAMPTDVVEARTGIPAIDLSVRALYETGYLHNHARMWLASYLVHVRKVHWHTGAQWMLAYLLDGDIASNHLSWQWVAGTGSSKPYLFNADNVAKYAPAHWHSPGTVIDTSYEVMARIAHDPSAYQNQSDSHQAGSSMAQPAVYAAAHGDAWSHPISALAAGRDVWLVHPWSLGEIPQSTKPDVLVIGIAANECQAQHPWSDLRWCFVTEGMQALTPNLWWGDTAQIAHALQTARSIAWQPNPHINGALDKARALWRAAANPPVVTEHMQTDLFLPVDNYCLSFSQWWRQTQLAV